MSINGLKTGGRRKGSKNKTSSPVKAIAARYGVDAIEALYSLMADKGQQGAVRVAAANSILDRGYGKPPQNILDEGTPKWPDIQITFVRGKAGDMLGETLPRLEAASVE